MPFNETNRSESVPTQGWCERSGASLVRLFRSAFPRQAKVGAERCALPLPSAIVLLALPACQSPRPMEGTASGQGLTSAVVYGRILSAAGTPVPGATVSANVHGQSANCRPGGPGLTGGFPVTSDSAGNYRQVVTAPVAPTELCVSVRVVPPTGSGLSTAGASGSRVRVLPDTSSVRDSVRVDVRVP
jgi:hypothetical protein